MRNTPTTDHKPSADNVASKNDDEPSDFSEITAGMIRVDATYRRAYIAHACERLLAGDWITAKRMLRDFVKGTIGFEELGRQVDESPERLKRMLLATGNLSIRTIAEILEVLQESEDITLLVRATDTCR